MGNVPLITLSPISFFSQGHKFQSFGWKIVLIYKQVAKVTFLSRKELEINSNWCPAFCRCFTSAKKCPKPSPSEGRCHSLQSFNLIGGNCAEIQNVPDKLSWNQTEQVVGVSRRRSKRTVPETSGVTARRSFFLHVQTLCFLLESDCPPDGECSGKTSPQWQTHTAAGPGRAVHGGAGQVHARGGWGSRSPAPPTSYPYAPRITRYFKKKFSREVFRF